MSRGSAPGERRGGRQKGTKNKKSSDAIAKAEASGLMPVEYMLQVMRDETAECTVRMDAAKAAAPYTNSKLAPKEIKEVPTEDAHPDEAFL